jgi:hypothetical protein
MKQIQKPKAPELVSMTTQSRILDLITVDNTNHKLIMHVV